MWDYDHFVNILDDYMSNIQKKLAFLYFTTKGDIKKVDTDFSLLAMKKK